MKRLIWVVGLVSIWASPLTAQGDFQKGISYYKQGQFERAVQEFEQLVEENPDYEAGYRVLGDSYLKLERFADAARAFHKAADLEEANFVSHYGAAVAEFNLQRFEDAVATLIRAEDLASAPRERYQLFQLRGSAFYNLDRFVDAVRDLERANSIQRGEFRNVLQLGIAKYRLGDYGEARRFLEQAAALRPDSEQASEFLAKIRFEEALQAIDEERFEEAVSTLVDYVDDRPRDGEAWYNLGLAYLFSDRLEAAAEAFERSSEILGRHWQSYNRLGYVHEKLGNYEQSLAHYRRAAELSQNSAVQESVERVEERIRRQNS